jgi:O-acetylserine/cysteine efflux transporter
MLVSALFLAIGTVLMRGLRGLDCSRAGLDRADRRRPLLLSSWLLEPHPIDYIRAATWVGWTASPTPRWSPRCSATASTTSSCSATRSRR